MHACDMGVDALAAQEGPPAAARRHNAQLRGPPAPDEPIYGQPLQRALARARQPVMRRNLKAALPDSLPIHPAPPNQPPWGCAVISLN